MKISNNALKLIQATETRNILKNIQRGIEKESLRSDSSGRLALTPHPEKLGSALCNDWLTTDFSEALLEFITPVHRDALPMLEQLNNLHRYTVSRLGDQELLWPSSMPGTLPADEDIPLAQYGSSNVGLMKTAYRRGLGNRYGRAMQCVAGIHYNFSLPIEYWKQEAESQGVSSEDLQTYISERYFDLIRNFRRYYWLIIYLFGASPVADPSFVQGRDHNLDSLTTDDLFLPYATSLRMGDLGYQSKAQQSIFVCYNELDSYINTLRCSLRTPYQPYQQYGVCVDGVYQQLSTSILQIENEFYSPIRPKRVAKSGQTPASALAGQGVEYIEVRCLDLNPFEENGINEETIAFLDLFLLSCLIADSPQCNENEFRAISENQRRIVNQGRKPELSLVNSIADFKEEPLQDLANTILDQMSLVASQLDVDTGKYQRAVTSAKAKVSDPTQTLSARVLKLLQDKQLTHTEFSLSQAKVHREKLLETNLNPTLESELDITVKESFKKLRSIEADDAISFEDYLSSYFSQ